MFSSTRDLYPQETSSLPPSLSCTNQVCFQKSPNMPWGQIHPRLESLLRLDPACAHDSGEHHRLLTMHQVESELVHHILQKP